MSKSILERAKAHMTSAAAAHLSSLCSLGEGLHCEVSRLLDVLDEKDDVIDQRNGEIKNLHSDATKLRAELRKSTDLNLDKQSEVTGLCREVAALKHDLAARANDDKLKADMGATLSYVINMNLPVAVAHDETQFGPFPADFFVRHNGKIVGIDAKYVILNTAPGGAMLTEAVVSQAEISVLDKTIHNKVCAALEAATKPGGVIFSALNK